MKISDVTICKNCKFHRNLEPGSARRDVWYNNICTAVTREEAVDFVTGNVGYLERNDLGQIYHTDEAHPPCRSINTGHCEYYKAKAK